MRHAEGVVDRARPWLAPLRPALDTVLDAWAAGTSVAQALNAALPAGEAAPRLAAGPLRFVPQAALPPGEAYEAHIARTATVPTREGLHDLFNGLVWLVQPALKRRLNELQAAALARHGVTPQRGPLRDALTLFDEFGALLQAPPALGQALRRRDWPCLFGLQRALWSRASLVLVGHALLEQLATAPRKPLTAHVLLDDPLALSADDWVAKPFVPLPVLGVPGWWPANQAPAFYDDAAVFRPPRPGAGQAGRKPSIDR